MVYMIFPINELKNPLFYHLGQSLVPKSNLVTIYKILLRPSTGTFSMLLYNDIGIQKRITQLAVCFCKVKLFLSWNDWTIFQLKIKDYDQLSAHFKQLGQLMSIWAIWSQFPWNGSGKRALTTTCEKWIFKLIYMKNHVHYLKALKKLYKRHLNGISLKTGGVKSFEL